MKQLTCGSLFFLCLFISHAQPVITSFTPLKGNIGTVVTIAGSGFASAPNDNVVYFGAVKATVVTALATQLTVLAPAGATYRPITVTTNGLTAYSKYAFGITFAGGGHSFTAADFPVRDDYAAQPGSEELIATDFDTDGKPDIGTCNSTNTGSISVYKNISSAGNALLSDAMPFSSVQSFQGTNYGDFDGDGLLDIIGVEYNNVHMHVLRNTSTNGTVSFDNALTFPAPITNRSPGYIAVRDFDGDGKPDFAVNYHGYNTGNVSLFRNTSTPGAISFSYVADFQANGGGNFMETGDIDNDGKPDLLISAFTYGTVSVLRNTSTAGTISFDSKVDFDSGPYGNGVAVGDIDEDGKLDIVSSVYGYSYGQGSVPDKINVFRNTSTPGNISFAAKIEYPVGHNPFKPELADIDGDGKIDMAVAASGSGSHPYNALTLFRNTSTAGNISFEAGFEISTLNNPIVAQVCDLDLDGRPEIVVSHFNTQFLSIFRNSVGITLPLKLLRFEATVAGGKNKLTWATAEEVNTANFIVEYSLDASNFIKAGEVAAAGSSSSAKEYSFLHTIQYSGNIYYRIRMVDKNGGYSFSPVRMIHRNDKTGIHIWPNPSAGHLHIAGINMERTEVYDNSGRLVLSKLVLPGNTAILDISFLPGGFYYLKVYSGGEWLVKKIRKI